MTMTQSPAPSPEEAAQLKAENDKLKKENAKLKAALSAIIDRVIDNTDYSTDFGPNLEMRIIGDITHYLDYNPIKETYDGFFERIGVR